MSLIDNLLNETSLELQSESAPVLVIDNELRTITIPPEVEILGVESDDAVTRLDFQMPKTYGEFDLSEFDIRINYLNTDTLNELSVGDAYIVTDKNISGENISFSWLVERNACKYEGRTEFIVCLRKSDGDGNIIQEFNTTVSSLPVLRGLETTEQVKQEYPDVIQQLLDRLGSSEEFIQDTVEQSVTEIGTGNIDTIWNEVFEDGMQ